MSPTISSIPPAERPRERLVRFGVESLSVTELVAIVLGSGSKTRPVLELSRDLVRRFPTVKRLLDAPISELKSVPGIGEAKAIQMKAVLGLACRYHIPEKLESLEDIFLSIRDRFGSKESLLVLLLNIKGEIFHQEMVAVGTLSEILVHPREVFAPAIQHGADKILLAHNHPSGDPTPSKNDVTITKELAACGKLLSIEIMDHLIIGSKTFTSMRIEGIIPGHENLSGRRSRLPYQPV